MKKTQIYQAAAIYTVVSLLYISFSDGLVYSLWPESADARIVSTLKGWGFVILTATLLTWLLLRLAHRETSRYRALLDNHHAVMLVLDPETLQILDASLAAEQFYGWSRAELLGRHLTNINIMPPDQIQAEIQHARLHKETAFHFRQRIASGEVRNVDAYAGPIELDGRHCLLAFITDVTDQRLSEETIASYVKRLEGAVLGTASAVSQMVELRDPYTAGHERRVGEMAAAIAAEMGLDDFFQQGLRIAGAVHDVGKIMVPEEILTKPGRLSDAEFTLIKEHAEQGYQVLKNVDFPWPVAEVARQHHERLDGSGYPQGLKADEILLEARIVAVADVVESMSSDRPYRAALGPEQALQEIERGAGSKFDADVVVACLRLFREKGYAIPA